MIFLTTTLALIKPPIPQGQSTSQVNPQKTPQPKPTQTQEFTPKKNLIPPPYKRNRHSPIYSLHLNPLTRKLLPQEEVNFFAFPKSFREKMQQLLALSGLGFSEEKTIEYGMFACQLSAEEYLVSEPVTSQESYQILFEDLRAAFLVFLQEVLKRTKTPQRIQFYHTHPVGDHTFDFSAGDLHFGSILYDMLKEEGIHCPIDLHILSHAIFDKRVFDDDESLYQGKPRVVRVILEEKKLENTLE